MQDMETQAIPIGAENPIASNAEMDNVPVPKPPRKLNTDDKMACECHVEVCMLQLQPGVLHVSDCKQRLKMMHACVIVMAVAGDGIMSGKIFFFGPRIEAYCVIGAWGESFKLYCT